MKAACGRYLNLWSEIGYEDETDINSNLGYATQLDIFIVFAEFLDDDDFNVQEMEDRARNAIMKWKMKHYEPGKTKAITSKIRKVLQREFFEEAVMVSVRKVGE